MVNGKNVEIVYSIITTRISILLVCIYKYIFYKRCGILTEHFIADTVDFINFPVFSPSDLEIKPNFTNTLTFLISSAVEIILILIYGTEQRSSWHPCRPVVWLTLAVYMLSAERERERGSMK